jgi:ATPase subunit of ABC transporter with duplicated ATPase domains
MLTDASHFDRDVIGFQNASFTWSNDDVHDGDLTPSRRKFTLRVNGELLFKRACINLIIGPTGSGKTSLLMALLGEMHFIPMSPDAWYHLPRSGGVSYAAQESWVQNETIRVSPIYAVVHATQTKSRTTSCLAPRTMRSDIAKVYFSAIAQCLWLTLC